MLASHLHDDQIQAYLDESLPPTDKPAIQAHLRSCADCRRAVASYQQLFAVLEQEEEFELSKNITRKILRQTHKQAVGALQFGLLNIFFVLAALIALSHVLLTYANIENVAKTAKVTTSAFKPLFTLIITAFENWGDKIQFDGLYLVPALIGLLGLFMLDRLVLRSRFKTSA